jgi:hypothetical protein
VDHVVIAMTIVTTTTKYTTTTNSDFAYIFYGVRPSLPDLSCPRFPHDVSPSSKFRGSPHEVSPSPIPRFPHEVSPSPILRFPHEVSPSPIPRFPHCLLTKMATNQL